jgi:hypothetical protein
MRTLLAGIDTDIGRIVTATHRMKIFSNTTFAVVSLHGFDPMYAKVQPTRFRQAVIGTGTQATYLWSDGMAALGLSDVSQSQAAAQVIESERLKTLDAAYYKVHRRRWAYAAQYISPEMPLGVAQAQAYLLGTDASPGSAQVVAAFGPHVGAAGGRRAGLPRTATAVGLQWANQAGFVLIAGHGTYRNRKSTYPAKMVDIAPTLAALMGLHLGPADGQVLADATFRPPNGSVLAQEHAVKRSASYLKALRAWQRHT